MFVDRDFVDDRRVGVVSDVAEDVCESFRYFGGEVYVLKEYLIDIHQ